MMIMNRVNTLCKSFIPIVRCTSVAKHFTWLFSGPFSTFLRWTEVIGDVQRVKDLLWHFDRQFPISYFYISFQQLEK